MFCHQQHFILLSNILPIALESVTHEIDPAHILLVFSKVGMRCVRV